MPTRYDLYLYPISGKTSLSKGDIVLCKAASSLQLLPIQSVSANGRKFKIPTPRYKNNWIDFSDIHGKVVALAYWDESNYDELYERIQQVDFDHLEENAAEALQELNDCFKRVTIFLDPSFEGILTEAET